MMTHLQYISAENFISNREVEKTIDIFKFTSKYLVFETY